MTRSLRRILTLVLLFVVIVFLLRRTNIFPSFKKLFKAAPVVVDASPLLVTQIKNIAQLMTIEAYNEVVVDSTRYPFGVSPRIFKAIPGNPLALLGTTQLVLIVRGKLIAGVNLQTLHQNNVQVKNDSLFIQLPRAQVLDVIINPSDVETFIERGDWDEGAATALKLRARNQMMQQAKAQGALQQAESRARQLVYTLFKNAGYKGVTVTTKIEAATSSGKQ